MQRHSNMQRQFMLLIVMGIMTLFQVVQAAPEAIGKILSVRGHVVADGPTGGQRQLARGSKLYQNDTVTSGSGAKAMWLFSDGSVVDLTANSTLTINDYAFDKDQGRANKSSMSLLQGGMETVTGLIAETNPKNYEVRTSLSTLGIRGTHFAVRMLNCQHNVSRIPVCDQTLSVYEGTVTVTMADGSQRIVTKGEKIILKPDGTVQGPGPETPRPHGPHVTPTWLNILPAHAVSNPR